MAITPLDEALRQRSLVGAIGSGSETTGFSGFVESGERAARGLQIYRTNAAALAERALAVAFPTVQALLGPADFKQLSREHWRDVPPQRGDLGEWGERLPAWLRSHAGLVAWPYLGDCAELDWLRHVNTRARDATFDAASLAHLEAGEPADLRFAMMPGVAVMASAWPIVSIFEAHAAPDHGFESVRGAVSAKEGEAALVARKGWRAAVHRIDAPTFAWTNDVLGGASIARALERAGPGFDLTAWLTRALREEWLQGVGVVPLRQAAGAL